MGSLSPNVPDSAPAKNAKRIIVSQDQIKPMPPDQPSFGPYATKERTRIGKQQAAIQLMCLGKWQTRTKDRHSQLMINQKTKSQQDLDHHLPPFSASCSHILERLL